MLQTAIYSKFLWGLLTGSCWAAQVMRVLTEERILSAVDHPFLANLYGTIQTDTHLHFLMEFCGGGELYALLMGPPKKRLPEAHMRFYTAEVLLALQYLHLLGFVYRCPRILSTAVPVLSKRARHTFCNPSRDCG